MTERESSALRTDPAGDPLANGQTSPAWAPAKCEPDLLRILDSVVPGESIAARYDRRERELVQLFSGLAVAECLELRQRLLSACPEHPAAVRFGRMIRERRNRILAFLADARGREAAAERQNRGSDGHEQV